jgi:low temperature requirement protein LtrA
MVVTIVPVSIALIGGALLGGVAQLALWLAAVSIEGITIYLTSQGGAWLLPSAAHYAERHGLVVILALGESIISIGLGASHSPLTAATVIASLVAIVIALGMWWLYFGRASEAAERSIDAMTGNRRTRTATIGTYLHFGIVAGILLASLGLGGAIENIGAAHAPLAFDWIALIAGLALFVSRDRRLFGRRDTHPHHT